MPYNSSTSAYERRAATVIDATPDGDTVAVAIDVKLDQGIDDYVSDINHHNANGNHFPATSVGSDSRFLKQSPAGVVSWADGVVAADAALKDFSNVASGAIANDKLAAIAPSKITQNASNRFFTDTERTKLTGIEAGAQVTSKARVEAALTGEITSHTHAISTLFSSVGGKIPESMLPDGPYIDGASFLGISDFPLVEVLAASTYSLLEMFGTFAAYVQTTSTAYTVAYTLTVPSNLSGVLRASCGHHVSSGSGTAYLQLLKNGVVVNTWTTTSGSSTLRTADVTISPGDVLTWQHKSSSSDVTITTSGVAAKGDKGFVIANAYKIVE